MPLDNHNIVGIGSKPAEGQGTVKIQFKIDSKLTTVTLQRVLYVPSSPYNLISLGKFHRAGHKVIFPLNSLDVEIVSKGGIKLAHCKNIGDVYAIGNVKTFAPGQPESNGPTLAFTAAPERTVDGWHRVFGHLSPGAVKELVDKHMVTGMKIAPGTHDVEQCTICIQAKQHIEPFPKEAQRTFTEIGDMTFTDVWGPPHNWYSRRALFHHIYRWRKAPQKGCDDEEKVGSGNSHHELHGIHCHAIR
jgi:hypothetical protein